jgi:carboxyl-terminal processing protease
LKPGGVAVLAAGLIAALCAGMFLGGHPDVLPDPLRDAFVDEETSLTAEAMDVIEDNYYRAVPADELSEGSIQGMVRQLGRLHKDDRFSHYFSPADLERFDASISGKFTGVGMSVTEVPRGLRIARVYPGTPAKEGGLRTGELVVAVNGETIAGQDSELISARIKGPEGTDVTLTLFNPQTRKEREVTLTRAEIDVPITLTRVRTVNGRKLGYVGLADFSEAAHAKLQRAVQSVRDKGAEGLVLDLRGNGGGLLREAILTSSIFVPEGTIVVRTDSRTQGKANYRATGGNLPQEPTVVLINRDTASAAEILTAAVAEDAGATVVGTRSFGKGLVQQVLDLSNGGALDLTIGEYFTGNGESLAGKGIQPDVRSSDKPATPRDEALDRAFSVLSRSVAQEN